MRTSRSEADNGLDPNGLTFPTAGDGNFDIEVTVTTSRSALLSRGEGVGKGIVLPPCDGQVVRVRLEKAEETNIRIVCGLPNDGTDGLWKARYSVGWASGRDQQTEGNRIQLGDGTVIDIDGGGAVSFRVCVIFPKTIMPRIATPLPCPRSGAGRPFGRPAPERDSLPFARLFPVPVFPFFKIVPFNLALSPTSLRDFAPLSGL